MPLYEYECDACGRRFEVIQKFSDSPIDVCTECGKGPVRKLMSSPAIQFKGSGWYITDYAQKGKSDSTPASSETKSAADTKSEGGSSATDKPAATTDTATASPKSTGAASKE